MCLNITSYFLVIIIIIKILFILGSERKHECLSRPAESTHNTFTQQTYTFNKKSLLIICLSIILAI